MILPDEKPVIDTTGTAVAPKDSLWYGLYLSPEDREKTKIDIKANKALYGYASQKGDYVGSYDDFIAESGSNELKYGYKENQLKNDIEAKKKLESDRLLLSALRNQKPEDFDQTNDGLKLKQQLDKYTNSERELSFINLRKAGVIDKEFENYKKFQKSIPSITSPKNPDHQEVFDMVANFENKLKSEYGEDAGAYINNQVQKEYLGEIEKTARETDPFYPYSFQGLAENNKYIDQEYHLKPLIKKTNEDIHKPEILEEIQNKVYDRNKQFIEDYKKNEPYLTPQQKSNFLEGLQSEMEAEMQNKYQQIYKDNDDLISTTLIPNEVKDYLDAGVKYIQNNRSKLNKSERFSYIRDAISNAFTIMKDEELIKEFRKSPEKKLEFEKKAKHYLLNKTTLYQNNGSFDTDVVKTTAQYLSGVLHTASKQTDNSDNSIDLLHIGSPDKARGINTVREQYKDSRNTLQYLQEVIDSGDDSWSDGHWIGRGIKDPWTESNMFKAYRDASDAYGLGKKMSKGEDLTFSDEIMAMAFGLKSEISSKQAVPTSYNVSSGISAMVPYIVSYIGSGALADAITKNALKHTGRQVEKEALKALALRQTKNLAKFIPRSILQSGINVQMWHPEYMRRRFELGLVDDGEGNFTPSVTKERTPGEAALQSAAITYAEIATESAGDLLMHPFIKSTNLIGRLGKKATKGTFIEPSIAKIGKGLEKMNESMFIRGLMGKGSFTTVKGAQGGNTRIIGDFLKERMGLHGFGEEYLEEFANSRLANIFTNDVNELSPDTKYINPVMYWNTKNEFTTAATVGGFALLTGMGGFAVNKIFKPNITMTINNKEGKQVTVKVPSNIMSLVNNSFNKETGLFDQKTIQILRDNGKINDTQFDVLQRYSAQTEYLHEQKGLIPERTEELKKKGYLEEQIKSMNLMDKFEYEIYSNYKDLHDAEVLPKNRKGQAQMPTSEYLEKTLAEKTKAKEIIFNKEVKSEDDLINFDKFTNQEEVLGKALSEIRTKETEKEKRYFERFRLYGLTEATPIGQQPRFADFTKFITVGNNIQQRIDLLDKKESRTKEEEAELEQLVEDKRLIRAYLATVTTNVEKQFQDFGAKTKDSELIAAEATSKTLVATISNSIAAIPEMTEEEKTSGVQDNARKEQLNDRKALEEYMSMHEQRLEIIEAEKKHRGGQDIEYDAPIDEEVIEPKEKIKKPRVKKKVVTPEPKVETEQTEEFGGNETAPIVESDKKKSTTEKRDKAKKRFATKLAETKATIEKANNRLNNIKPEFLSKVKVSIDAISKKLDKNFEDEQKVNDPQFKTWSKTHDVVVNIWTKNPNARVTQGQAKAIKFLSKTGIITESDYNQKLDNKMRDADTAIWLAVKRVQFLRSQTAEGSKEYNDLLELQKTVFALIQAEQNHARYSNINTSLQNLDKLDSNEIERELQKAQDKIDKNNELIKRSLTEEEVLKLRKEVQTLEDKIEVNKERLRKDKNLTSAKEQSIRLANSKMEIEVKNKQDIMKSRLRPYSEAKLKTELEEQSEYIDALNEEKAVRKEQKDINDKKKKKKESKKKEEVVSQEVKDYIQSENYDCGASALRSVLNANGETLTEVELVNKTKSNAKDGTLIKNIVSVSEQYNYSAKAINTSLEDVSKQLDNKNHVILLIEGVGKTIDGKDYSKTKQGHYIVIKKIDGENITFEDPATKGDVIITKKELEERWHGLADDGKQVTNKLAIFINNKKNEVVVQGSEKGKEPEKEEDEKEEVTDFESLRKELFAQSIETKNKKFSKPFPNILFDNMITALNLLEKAMNSGFNSYEKIALETFSLFEKEAGKNEEFSNDHELIYDVFLNAFSGKLNPSIDENGKEIENKDVVKYRTMFKTVFDNKLKSAEKRIKKALRESLSNSGNVMTTSDQRIQEQQNNLSGLFRTIATEEGVQYDKIELDFFLEAKKGTFKNIKSEKDYLEFLVELNDSDDAFSQKLLYGIYENNINFSWFISYRNFYENVSLVRNESIILKSGKAKNKFEISFLNPEFTIDTLVKLFTSHIEGYKINTKTESNSITNIDGLAFKTLLENFDSKGSKFQNLVNLLQHDQISMREIFENELDLLQQLTGIDREVWRDNYFFDNATKENEVYLKALTKDSKTTHIKVKFNNYNDFLDFNYNTANDILKKVENGVTVYNGPEGLSELGFVIDNSTKSKFSNIDSIVDDKPYYKTGERFDTSISTKLIGTLKANFRKAKSREGFNAKDFVKDYFLSDIKGEVYSNIAKLSTSHNASTKLWTSGRDLDHKRFTAFVLSNNMTTALDEAYQNKDTDFMKELSKRGLKPELTIQRGAKGLSFGENEMQSNTEDNSNISNSDYWIFQMIYFDENPSSYNALAGQFGDKDALYYVRSPKYDFHKGQKKNQEFLNKNIKGFNALVDFFNQSFGTRVSSTFGLDNEQTKEFITQFIFNFVKNADALNSIINGDFEKNYKGNFIDMVKRGAPVISPGYCLVDVEGGLGKTYSHIVIEDPKAIGIGGKEFELPNGIQICSSDFFGKFQRNMGSVYSREHQFTNLTSSKALHSATRDGVRSLTKANLMSIDVFIDTFGEESFGWLRDFMKEHEIDTISFDSGTKKNEHPVKSANASKKGSLLLFNKDLSRKEISSEEISKFVFNREKKDLYIQQDLRHDVKPKGNALPSQSKSNILSIEGSKEFIALMNKQMDVMLDGIEQEFKGLEDNNEKVKFILSLLTKQSININTINGEEEVFTDEQKKGLIENLTGDKKFIAQRLLSGTSPNDIFIRDAVIKKILSYVEQNGLLMFGNRQTTEAIPDIFNQLKGYEIVTYKGKKYTRLAQIAANVPNGRYPEIVDAKNIKEVFQYIEKNKAKYTDLYDENGNLNEWEIEVSKDSKGKIVYTIPGELIMSSRVPGDDLHSHTLCRLTLGHADSKANITALNQKLSEASGEDYDGDQRYNQVFFKDGQNIILDDSKEGLSNKGLLSMRKGYQNPENIEIISNPIDVEKYDDILARLAERSKENEIFYNYKEQNNPLTWQESRNNNLVGVKMKGITTNLSTVYSYLNYIKPETKKDSIFNIPLYDSNGVFDDQRITLNGISNDKFNIIKSHIGYLQNLSFDNAKDPKIEKLGFNEWTANMFIFALINDKSLSSDIYNSRAKMDKAVTDRIENIANLFNRPAFKLYAEFCRERKSVNEFESNAEVQKAALKYIEINAKEDRDDIKALKGLLKASKDLATIKSVQRLTENLPKTFEEFVMNESSIDRMEGNTLSFYDMSNFILEESGNLVPLLENSRKSTTASRKFAFDNSVETSRITQYVINEVQKQLSEDNEDLYVRVDEKTLKDILSNIQTFIALVATSRGDSFNIIRDRLLKSLTELKRNSKEQNKFLDIIQMLKETKVDKETLSISEDNKPMISVMNAYRHVEFDDNVMEDIRNDFDKLDANTKDDFFEYLLYIYGNRIASSSGSFYKFMSFDFLNEKSDIIEQTMNKWSNDDYGNYSLEQIKSGVLKNLQIFKRKRFETKKQFDLSDTNDNQNKLNQNFEEFVRSFTLNEVNRVLTGKDISVLKQIVEEKGETIENFQQGFRRYAASRSYINKIRDVFHTIEKLLKEETISNNSTATTRVYPLGSHMNENTAFAETNMVGRLFKKKGTSEFYVVESVEKLTKEKINDSKWINEWCRKESKTIEEYKNLKKENKIRAGMYQTTFRKVDAKELTTAQNKVNNTLPKQYHGQLIYATPASGKSFFVEKSGNDGIKDVDALIIETLDELNIDHDNVNFGIVAKDNKDIVWKVLKKKIIRLKQEGYTLFTGSFYFTTNYVNAMNDGGLELVDLAILLPNSSEIVDRTKKRTGREILKTGSEKLIKREGIFNDKKVFNKEVVTLKENETLSDYFNTSNQATIGKVNANNAFKSVEPINESGNRVKSLTLSELAKNIKGINPTIDDILERLVKKHGNLPVNLNLDVMNVQGNKVAKISINGIEFYRQSIGENFEYYLQHELEHLETMFNARLVAEIQKNLESFKKTSTNPSLYGFKNADEFLAEYFSNENFPSALSEESRKTIKGILKGNDIEDKKEVKNHIPDSANDALLTSNPKLAESMIEHFAKVYPEIEFFSNREKFIEYCERNGKRGLQFDMRAVGHAFDAAVFIDTNRAVQSSIPHEYAHIYWDMLPDTHFAKKQLRELFSEVGVDKETIDERIILEIGKLGVGIAEANLNVKNQSKFLALLKSFWNAIKALFSKKDYSQDALLQEMSEAMWNRKPQKGDRFNQTVVHNMIQSVNPDGKPVWSKDGGITTGRLVDSLTGERYTSPSQVKNMLDPSEFNKEAAIEAFIRGIDNPFESIIAKEREFALAEMESAAKAGEDIHNIINVFFSLGENAARDIPTRGFYSSELIGDLIELQESILKEYPDAVFSTEITFADRKSKTAGVIDLLVETYPNSNQFFVYDFKTFAKDKFIEDDLDKKKWSKSNGMFNNPLPHIKSSTQNKHKVQLFMYKNLIESQDNGSEEKNKVLSMFVVPIARELDIIPLVNQETGRVEINDETGNEQKTYHILNARIKNLIPLKGTAIGDIRMAEILQEFVSTINNNAISFKDLRTTLKEWDELPVRDAHEAINSLTAILAKDLSKITGDDVLRLSNQGVHKILRTLVDTYGFEYEDFYDQKDNHGSITQKALPFELLIYSFKKKLNKDSALLKWKDGMLEEVKLDRVKTGSNAGLSAYREDKNAPWQYFEELGYDDLFKVPGKQPKLQEGERIAEYVEYTIHSKQVKQHLVYGTAEKIYYKDNHSISYIKMVTDEGEKIIINKLGKHSGVIKVVKEPKDTIVKFNLQKEFEKDGYTPSMKLIKERKKGEHFDLEMESMPVKDLGQLMKIRSIFNEIGTVENFTKIVNGVTKESMDLTQEIASINHDILIENDKKKKENLYERLDEAQKKLNNITSGKEVLTLYEQIRDMDPQIADVLGEVISESLYGRTISEQVVEEHKFGVRTYPKATEELFQMIKNPDGGLFSRIFKKGNRWMSARKVAEAYPMVNLVVNEVTNAYLKSQIEMNHFSQALLELSKPFDGNIGFVTKKVGEKNYFRHYTEFNILTKPDEYNFLKFMYDTYNRYELIVHDKENLIPVPSDFIHISEMSDRLGKKTMWGGALFNPIRNRIVHSALAPAEYDNEMIDFPPYNEPTSLLEIKKYYVGQLSGSKDLETIFGEKWEYFKNKFRKSSLTSGALSKYDQKAKAQYQSKQKKNPAYRLNSHVGKDVAMDTRLQFKYLEKHGRQLIHNFYFGQVVPTVDYVLNKYNDVEFNQKGETTQNTFRWIKDFTNILIFQKTPEGTNKELKEMVNTVMRAASMGALSWNIKAQGGNLTIGYFNDLIHEFKATVRGASRVKNMSKIIRIMNQSGVATIVNDAEIDKLDGNIKRLFDWGFKPMEWSEKSIQGILFAGLMTDEQIAAYDEDGDIIDEKNALSTNQLALIRDRISQIHGDYNIIYTAPAFHTPLGAAGLQFKKWIINTWDNNFASYTRDRNHAIHSGKFTSLMLLWYKFKHNNLKSLEERKEEVNRITSEFEQKSMEARKRNEYVKISTFENTSEYVDMLKYMAQENPDYLIKLTEHDKYNQFRAMAWVTVGLAAAIGMSSGDGDDKYYKKVFGSKFLSWFMNNLADATFIINPWRIASSKKGFLDLTNLIPAVSYGAKCLDVLESLYYTEQAMFNEFVPEAYYDANMPSNSFARKGWLKAPFDLMGILPGGASIKQIFSLTLNQIDKEERREYDEAVLGWNDIELQTSTPLYNLSDETLRQIVKAKSFEESAKRKFGAQWFNQNKDKIEQKYRGMNKKKQDYERKNKRFKQQNP